MLFARKTRSLKTILIVEDEPLVAFDNEHFLTESGYDVVATVDSVEAAIEVIESQPPDLVLADVKLSDGGNGVDVAAAAREKGVPVLFVTGGCPDNAAQLAVGCLVKPYSSRDLRTAIEAVDCALQHLPVKKVPACLQLYLENVSAD